MSIAFIFLLIFPIISGLNAMSCAKTALAITYCYFACKDKVRLHLTEKSMLTCKYSDGENTYILPIARTGGEVYADVRKKGKLIFCNGDLVILLKNALMFVVSSYICADMLITLIKVYAEYAVQTP